MPEDQEADFSREATALDSKAIGLAQNAERRSLPFRSSRIQQESTSFFATIATSKESQDDSNRINKKYPEKSGYFLCTTGLNKKFRV